MRIKKLDAARRQLDAAVRAFFHGEDAIAVHTLVGAASNIISDLVRHKAPDRSWDKYIAQDNNLTEKEYFRIAKKAQNFFKHANLDPDGEFEFDQRETDDLIFMTSLNLTGLCRSGEKLSDELSLFQFWYIAVRRRGWNKPKDRRMESLIEHALDMFPDIEDLPRDEQLHRGREVLRHLRLTSCSANPARVQSP
jgi:hypothetical protein